MDTGRSLFINGTGDSNAGGRCAGCHVDAGAIATNGQNRNFNTNVVSTVEGVVDFYNGPEFNTPRAPAARFNFNQTQRDQIADFLRGINTLQNIDVARRELQEILDNRKGTRAARPTGVCRPRSTRPRTRLTCSPTAACSPLPCRS